MYILPAADTVFTDEWEIKRSRFITHLRRVMDEDEARAFIADVRAQYPDARHHCSAYLLYIDGANPVERSSDDGEPSGTAGKPMLDVLRGSGMLNVAAVVTRYFGGIKLGAGGLVHAYSASVSQTLPSVQRVRRDKRELYIFQLPHDRAGAIEADLRARGTTITDVAYTAEVTYTVALQPGQKQPFESLLAQLTSGQFGEVIPAGESWVEEPLKAGS